MLRYEYRLLNKCRITEVHIYRNEIVKKQGCDSEWVNKPCIPANLLTHGLYINNVKTISQYIIYIHYTQEFKNHTYVNT